MKRKYVITFEIDGAPGVPRDAHSVVVGEMLDMLAHRFKTSFKLPNGTARASSSGANAANLYVRYGWDDTDQV